MNYKPTQLLFIDATVNDIETLFQGALPGIEAHVLSGEQDGVAQITQILQHRPEVNTLHIVSHGSPGCLYLGKSQLSLDTLNIYTSQLQSWSRDGLTLMVYGCNVAATDAGEEFVNKLHQLTGSNIAACVTLTGNANLGGNWILEMKIGVIDAPLAITPSTQSAYAGILSPSLIADDSISLPGVQQGSVAWGDYSGDGKLDLILTGYGISKLYKNNGSGVLTEDTSLALPGVYNSSVAWGDYSGDGKLDLILTGYEGNNGISKLYKNNCSGVLTEDTSLAPLPGVYNSSVAWGDYSGDGKLDLILTGYEGNNGISKLYKNNGSGVLTEDTSLALPGVYNSSVAWGDYSGDGKLDLILTGDSNNGRISKLYKNNGSGVLTEDTSLALPGVNVSSVAWGDYSGDGKLDLIFTGYSNNGPISKLYKNNSSGVLTEDTSLALPAVYYSSVAWGDYSGDGKLDLILTGYNNNDPISKLYKNNGSGVLTEDTSLALPGVNVSSVAWGDYSSDGKLDLILTGDSNNGPISKLYKNASNNAPTSKLSKIADDIFKIFNSSSKSKLQVTLTGQSSNLVNELGVFTVDDAQGNINGIAPGAASYAQAALDRAKVIFSAIANLPNGFNTDNLTHLLEFNSDDNFRFYLVKNSTTDAVRVGITPLTDILFSDPLTQKITDLGNDDFSLGWKDGSGNNAADFKNLVVKIQSTNDSLPLGTNLQGNSQGEVIDLRGVTSQVKADFVVNREAAFNNFIGFYQVADENGGIDTNSDGKADILTGQAGYTEAAVRGRVAGIDLTVNNQGSATSTGTFQPGSIFVPFIIANGMPNALLDSNPNNDPAVYFPFLGANTDKVDHIRLLGNNVFGFEDLASGGDKDFNDMIVRVNMTIA